MPSKRIGSVRLLHGKIPNVTITASGIIFRAEVGINGNLRQHNDRLESSLQGLLDLVT
jgi:hypothetical protein